VNRRAEVLAATAAAVLLACGAAAPVRALADLPAHCATHGLVLQVLGSGGPELQDQRASSSYLVWSQGQPTVLVDAGGGSALRFGQSGASVAPLEVILLTHLHVDHTADLPALVKSSFFEERAVPLPLYGPAAGGAFPATTRFVNSLFGAPDGAYRYLAGFVSREPGDTYRLEAHDLRLRRGEIRRIHDAHGVQVYAVAVAHGNVPAIAYRVEIGSRQIVFSGDTNGEGDGLRRLAQGADLLVAHNAVPEGASGVERALHMPPSVIGRVAHEAAVGQLVLSHRMLRTLGHEADTEAAIRSSYTGPVRFADDLDCIQVP
jgi:ribonuclease BN (tRNA processing enzyme)